MKYLKWDEKVINDFGEKAVAQMYDSGYVFTRIGKGVMQKTRLIRIDLSKFELSSENRRILKKNEDLKIRSIDLPLSDYDWHVAKLAKDFYDTKFTPGIVSVSKIKELLTIPDKSNFNKLFIYSKDNKDIGYTISYQSDSILHYSYPFYDLKSPKDTGMGMMILAIQHAKEKGLKYIYLGSLQRPNDTYKLQFNSIEWFDENKWSTDLKKVKNLLTADISNND